jgi:hypothetical protein
MSLAHTHRPHLSLPIRGYTDRFGCVLASRFLLSLAGLATGLRVTAPKGWLTLFAHLYLAFGAGYLAPVQMVDVEVMAAIGAFNLD